MSLPDAPIQRVAVVGAGIGGLAATRLIARIPGVHVTLYERTERPGGVIGTSQEHGYMREHAANGFLPERDGYSAIDLCRELGVELVEASPAAKNRWIYRNGALHALPTSPLSFARSRLLSARGKLALLAEPFRSRADVPDESIHEFASRRLGKEIADAMVAPFLKGIFGGDAREISVRAGFPMLVELEERGGLFLGGVRTVIERRRANPDHGGEHQVGGESTGKGTRGRLSAPRDGVGALTQALASVVGDALMCGREVSSLSPGPVLHFEDGSSEPVDLVVLATPAHAAARLVSDWIPELAEVLSEIPYAPIAVVHLGVDRSHTAHPLDGFGFLVADGEDLRMLGTVFESTIYQDRAPHGYALLRAMFGGANDAEVMELSDEELVDQARTDLHRALGDFSHVRFDHTNVVRWPRAIAQYTVGHGERVVRAEALAAPSHIVLAGSAYHGVAVNKIVSDAQRVARVVAGALSLDPGESLA